MTGKYTLIYADPPWTYRDKAADGERGAGFKYPVMNVLDICRLPVWDLSADDCLLATLPHVTACWLFGAGRAQRSYPDTHQHHLPIRQ